MLKEGASDYRQDGSLVQGISDCIEAYCQFDPDGNLLDWNPEFVNFYPPLKDIIKPGLKYRDFVLGLYKRSALRNLQHIENLDSWYERQSKAIGKKSVEFIHELHDGRTVLIKHRVLSNGNWLFSGIDVSALGGHSGSLMDDDLLQDFAQLSSDWFWELDKDLCYTFHSAHKQPLAGESPEALVGRSRVQELNGMVVDNADLRKHNRQLRKHRFVDVTLSWHMPDGSYKHSKILAQPRYDKSGKFSGYIGCGRDVTQQHEMAEQLAYHARHDDLTGLLNRRAFAEILDQRLAEFSSSDDKVAKLPSAYLCTLTSINLDCFKIINEDVGHAGGDQLLTDVTGILFEHYGESTVVARLGGDQFGVIAEMRQDEALDSASAVIKKIREFDFSWQNRKFSISGRAGVMGIDARSCDSSDLLSKVEIACHCAKLSGRNQALVYNNQNSLQAEQNVELRQLKLLKYAMHNQGLHLYLQPIVPTSSYTVGQTPDVMKFEVLLRVRDRDGQLISPAEVIPIAEKYDMMHRLDLWVVDSAINHVRNFQDKGVKVALSVNLSGNTLSNAASLSEIANLVERHNIEPGSLCFEITETAAINGIDEVCAFMQKLKLLGCDFSLDDFGSGLSSFGYLKALEVDFLKIDGSFVKNICTDAASRAIVASFNTLSHEMGMKTVAEFVENDEIVTLLKDLDIDYLQGFGVGVPRDVQEWLSELDAGLQQAS